VCDEQGIGGSGEYCCDSDAQIGPINLFYDETSGGMCVLRAMLFDIEPGVISAVTVSRHLASSSARETSLTIRAGKNLAKDLYKMVEHQFYDRPYGVAACVVYSKLRTGIHP
jgi:hypothetical protein